MLELFVSVTRGIEYTGDGERRAEKGGGEGRGCNGEGNACSGQ